MNEPAARIGVSTERHTHCDLLEGNTSPCTPSREGQIDHYGTVCSSVSIRNTSSRSAS